MTDQFSNFNIPLIQQNINKYSSEKLCEMIVCQRYFGLAEELAIICMTELADRRANGNNFDFEGYIDNAYSQLPVLNFSVPDLRSILQKLATNQKK